MFHNDIDDCLDELMVNGAVKLRSVKNAPWRNNLYSDLISQIGAKSYGENLPANINFLNEVGIIDCLVPKLAQLAQSHFNKKISKSDIYNVCRLVRPGDSSEGYRGHFDSHLFTLVTPINIPDFKSVQNGGQLHFYPNGRKHTNSELRNVFDKISFKKYNSKRGFDRLAKLKTRKVENFSDYKPLLFLGNTTFHGNAPVHSTSSENRMTILTHFFDPSPKYGVGNIMRKLRRR